MQTQVAYASLFILTRLWKDFVCSTSIGSNHGLVANFQQLLSQLYGLNIYDSPHMLVHLMTLYIGKNAKELFIKKHFEVSLNLGALRHVLKTEEDTYFTFNEVLLNTVTVNGIAIVIALMQTIGIECTLLKARLRVTAATEHDIVALQQAMAARVAATKDKCLVIEFARGTGEGQVVASFYNYVVLKIAKHIRTNLFCFFLATPNRSTLCVDQSLIEAIMDFSQLFSIFLPHANWTHIIKANVYTIVDDPALDASDRRIRNHSVLIHTAYGG